tara:strand:+ start:2122 stop:4632 length:2511 start_codon:yes stop_codon:yes gene_type:complete
MSDIKHIMIHYGKSNYLDDAINISKNHGNDVVLLSDDHIEGLKNDMYFEFEKIYQHMSTCYEKLEKINFLRWFILYEYMVQNNLDKVFYSDSDVAILCDINETLQSFDKTMYAIPEYQPEYRWSMSGHTSLWNIGDLKSFCEFCISTYSNNIEKLKEKHSHHEKNNIRGGITDMTLFYLFYPENRDKILNICDKELFGGAFDLSVNSCQGRVNNEFVMDGPIKKIVWKDGEAFFEGQNKNQIAAKSIHCQGPRRKGMLSDIYKKIKTGPKKKIISYCFFLPKRMLGHRKSWDKLFEDTERYWYNLPCVCVLDSIFYPDYVKRFYVTQNVLDHELGGFFHEIQKLPNFEVEVIEDGYEYREHIAQRFRPFWEDWDIVLLRDIDSVLTGGEWSCNRVFEESPDAHVYSARSHAKHRMLMGGLCGFKPKMIQDKLEDSVENFISRHAPTIDRKYHSLDQLVLNKAFTNDKVFSREKYYDMPIHHAKQRTGFPCKKVVSIKEIQSHKLTKEMQRCLSTVEKYVKPRWAGMPVDLRGGATEELVEYNTAIKDIIYSSDKLIETYTTNKKRTFKAPTSWSVPLLYRNPNSHKGDTSRELISMWDESGYCKLIDCESTLSWWGDEGDVLLYEFNCEDSVPVPKKENINLGLFGNYKPSDWGLHWIFWGRRPRLLEKRVLEGILSYSERDISSVFIGNIENATQGSRRLNQDWSHCTEIFSMLQGHEHKYTQEEYLNTMAKSRYGLCLAGYGRKCNREVECMGLGTVPIVAPEVDMNYYDSPQEGIHYFRASSPEEVKALVAGTSESDWKRMSDNCVEWWNKNCSRWGSFKTTKMIIEENYGIH